MTTEALTGRDNVRRERIVLDVFFAETHKANFAFGDWLRRRVAMNRADRSVAMPWMTSGWALISETGVGVEAMGGYRTSLNARKPACVQTDGQGCGGSDPIPSLRQRYHDARSGRK